MLKELEKHLQFVDISNEDMSIFEWKPPRSFKSFLLDLNIVKKNKANDVFFHIDKGNMKIVHIRKNNLIYTIGSDKSVQFQILEALLEKIDEEFHDMYDIEVIFSYGNTTSAIFKAFKQEIERIIEEFPTSDLIKKVDVHCRVCKTILPLYIKKSIMKEALSFPIPIVYNHKGHALVCYIDQDFVVRGVELVNITG
ncbi:MAG: hypothetical protein EU539_00630 [Promethearchaeota archaeon]|nr:MAG: hypothetical protein EU539_00630 [Candidatus Lokiarchaeota archaeon]